MRMKKTFAVFIILIMIISTFSFAQALTITFNPSDIEVYEREALIKWESDELSDSEVVYGDNINNVSVSVKNLTPVLNHSVLLQNLNVSTTYYYKIISTNENGSFELNNSNSYYSFTTTQDTTPPFINTTIPRFYNSARLIIEGITEPRALVHAYANPSPNEVGIAFYDRETFADEQGNFRIVNLPLDASLNENLVVLWVMDRAGNTNTTSGFVSIDTTPPNVIINIPSSTTTGSLEINGTTDENITVVVYAAPYNESWPVSINESHILENETIETTNLTNFSVSISLTDYKNVVRVVAYDRAGNEVVEEKQVLYDSEPPVFEYPTSLEIYSPSYTQELEIEGKLSEFGYVTAYVNGNKQNTVQTDEEGNFNIELTLKRELVDINDTGIRVTSALFVNGTIVDSWDNLVVLEATDKAGLSTNLTGTITYTLCGYGTWWNIERPLPMPEILSPILLLEGNAQLSFNFKLSWQGIGEEGTITGVDVSVAPISRNYTDFYDEDWITQAATTTSQDKKAGYYVVSLKAPDPTPAGENWTYTEKLENISKHRISSSFPSSILPQYNCKTPGTGCVKLPLILSIEFTSPLYNGTQKQCWDVEVPIDSSLFIADFIPDKFLKSTIRFLNDTIELINKTLEPVKEVSKITAYTCVGSFLLQYWYYFKEYLNCEFSSYFSRSNKDGKFTKENALLGCGDRGQISNNLEGDAKDACGKCRDTIEKRMRFEEKQRWVCDRIFSPSAPTLQKYAKDNLENKYSYCSGTHDSQFYITTWENAKRIYSLPFKEGGLAGKSSSEDECPLLHAYANVNNKPQECCGVEYLRKWNSACFFMNELKASACLQNQALVAAGLDSKMGSEKCYPLWNAAAGFCDARGGPTPEYVNTGLKFSTKSLTYNADGTCEELFDCRNCDNAQWLNDWKVKKVTGQNFNVCYFNDGQPCNNDGNCQHYGAYCYNVCKDYAQNNNKDVNKCNNGQNQADVYLRCSIIQRGGASSIMDSQEIFFRIVPEEIDSYTLAAKNFKIHSGFIGQAAKFPSAVSSVTGQTGDNFRDYAQGKNSPIQMDTEFIVWPKEQNAYDFTETISEVNCEECLQQSAANCQKFEQFYEKLKGITQEVVTKQRACSIYNEIRTKIGVANQDYIVDPTSGILRSFQCVALPSITSHLSFWKNVLTAVRNCFVNIMTTGEGDPTVCRETLSVYICDMIYDALRCFVKRYSLNYNRPEQITGIQQVLGALTSAGSGVASSLNERYGGSQLFQSIFGERRLTHAICLFAFTGDWVFDFESFFEADYPVPINSTVIVMPRERRFVSANPLSTPPGLATHNYRIGLGIVAGSDLTFNINLICSDDYSCDPAEGFKGGKCDCVDKGKKTRAFILRTVQNSLAQGEALGAGGRGVVEDNQFEDEVRYDKVEVIWKYKDEHGNEVTGTTGPIPIKQAGGEPPVECEFDDSSLKYSCNLGIGATSYTILREVVPQKDTFDSGDYLKLEHIIYQRLPEDAELKCAGASDCEYTNYLFVKVFNQKNQMVWPRASSSIIDYTKIPPVSEAQTIIAPESYKIREADFGFESAWGTYPLVGDVSINNIDLTNVQNEKVFIIKLIKNGNNQEYYGTCDVTTEQELTNKKIRNASLQACKANTPLPNTKKITYGGAEVTLGTITYGDCSPYQIAEDSSGQSINIDPCSNENGKCSNNNCKVALVGLKVKSQGAGSMQCTSDPKTWKVVSTIYAPQIVEGVVGPSGQVVMYAGMPQEKTTEISVRCKKPTTTGASGSAPPRIESISYQLKSDSVTIIVDYTPGPVNINDIKNNLVVKKDGQQHNDFFGGVIFTSADYSQNTYSATIKFDNNNGDYEICVKDTDMCIKFTIPQRT